MPVLHPSSTAVDDKETALVTLFTRPLRNALRPKIEVVRLDELIDVDWGHFVRGR